MNQSKRSPEEDEDWWDCGVDAAGESEPTQKYQFQNGLGYFIENVEKLLYYSEIYWWLLLFTFQYNIFTLNFIIITFKTDF